MLQIVHMYVEILIGGVIQVKYNRSIQLPLLDNVN